MASFIKSKLKNAREAIAKKDFSSAKDIATDILSYEPDNYNATVFLGLALLELGLIKESEQAYRKAIELNPDQILAWQGITRYYERVKQWDDYANALESQMKLFIKSADATRCAEMWQKLLECRRQYGSRKQVVDVLYKILPESPYYAILSELPPPDPTSPTSTTTFEAQSAIYNSLDVLNEIVALTEKDEHETITKEVDRRRMRLNSSGVEQLNREVGLDIWASSKIPVLYNEILNHPYTTDDLRRSTESKLLRYKQRYLHALPSSGSGLTEKQKVGLEIDELVNGMVLLNIPDELAWMLFIDEKDSESIPEYDTDVLRRFTKLFPNAVLTKMITGYFWYTGEAIRIDDDDDESEKPQENIDLEDAFAAIVEAGDKLKNSVFAARILCDVYERESDYQSIINTCEHALKLIKDLESKTAKKLPKVSKALKVSLAVGLVHLYPPKHHSRAALILNEILKSEPNNIVCLVSRAYILQCGEKWHEAEMVWGQVLDLTPDQTEAHLEAVEEQAWCQVRGGLLKDGMRALQTVRDKYDIMEIGKTKKARVWWRLGKCKWDLGEHDREESYSYFITSLKMDPSYAPAYTSLGIYYSDFASPTDPKRATKCFQKAFELDAREVEAARRLAESFANDREWDLVDVIANRIIEGEGGLEGGIGNVEKLALARAKPTNAWAWKALGVAELERRNYAAAIQSFQICLRTDTDDGHAWMFLGEAYSRAGRHSASLRALNKSMELQSDNWLCLYQIGEVQRELGLLEEANETFKKILSDRPFECGVMSSLSRNLLVLGRSEKTQGFTNRAEDSFILAIEVALRIIAQEGAFRKLAWKNVIDALFELREFSSYSEEKRLRDLLSTLTPLHSFESDGRLVDLIRRPIIPEDSRLDQECIVKALMATCSFRIQLFAEHDTKLSGAWYDLALALFHYSQFVIEEDGKKVTDEAIAFIKNAIKLNPHVATYWNAFGCFNFSHAPKLAQHGFIKSLEYDIKSAITWTNLGFLYLENKDHDLANEAIRKALVVDPDYTPAWICQALLNVADGDEAKFKSLLTHAVSLQTDIPEADLDFATLAFKELSSLKQFEHNTTRMSDLLIPAFFSIHRYCRRRGTDPTGLHLFALICERLGHLKLANQIVMEAIGLLESTYEKTEDPSIERQYAIANTTLGRLLLSDHEYEDAITKFDLAFGLIAEDNIQDETMILRASCRLGCGLAHFRLGNIDQSIMMFESALDISQSQIEIHGHIAVLFAKVMWTIGTEEFRDAAKSQLFDCVSKNPGNLSAVISLAAIGSQTNDEALLDAALSEIMTLSLEDRLHRDPKQNVEDILCNFHVSQGNDTKALILRQQAVHAHPAKQASRHKLAQLLISLGQANAAIACLSPTLSSYADADDLPESLRLMALAQASAPALDDKGQQNALNFAQKAVKLLPSSLDTWNCIESLRSHFG